MILTTAVDEAIIPHGPYSTLMASPPPRREATMAEDQDYILRSGLQVGDALPRSPSSALT